MHFHAGEEDAAVFRVGVYPTEEDDVLLLVGLPHVLLNRHGAVVRVARLFRNYEVGQTELVIANGKPTAERPKSLDILVTVQFGDIEEL